MPGVEAETKPNEPGQLERAAYAVCEIEIEKAAADGKAATDRIWFVASSEEPMDRYGYDPAGNRGRWREVLSHDPGGMELERLKAGKVPLLFQHDEYDQVGAVDADYKLANKELRVRAEFCEDDRSQRYRRDVLGRRRRGASVGYTRKRARLIEQNDELGPLWLITLWQLEELSLVSIPANPAAGAASHSGGSPVEVEKNDEPPALQESSPAMPKQGEEEKVVAASAATAKASAKGEADPGDTISTIEVTPEKRIAEIVRLCEIHGVAHRAADWIEQGLSRGEVSEEILHIRTTRPGAQRQASQPVVDLPKEDRRRYSYARAIAMEAGLKGWGTGVKFDGLEAEVHREIIAKLPEGVAAGGGLYVPLDLRGTDQEWQERRATAALDSKSLNKGSELVFDQPGELIELLRTRTAVMALGARVLSGLSAPIPFPRQTGAVTASWVGENPGADVSDSDLTLGLVNLSGKSLQASTAYSRQLLIQGSVDVEALVRGDIAAVHSRAIDKAALHGLGASGQPTGIYKAPDVNAKAMAGVPDYIKVIDMEALVADDNADEGSLGWITTPLMAAKMKTTPEHATATMANWIWQGDFQEGVMGGYRARATNQVSKLMTGSEDTGGAEHGMVFGNWNDLVIGLFGALELVVDPYAKKKRALIEVTSFQMADLILRHPESFAKATGATTS